MKKGIFSSARASVFYKDTAVSIILGDDIIGPDAFPAGDGRYLTTSRTIATAMKVQELFAHVNGTGGAVQVVIWADDGPDGPGTLLIYSAPISVLSSGWVSSTSLTGSTTLPAGTYWIGVSSNGYYSTFSNDLAFPGSIMLRSEGGSVEPPADYVEAAQAYSGSLSVYASGIVA
jgi:hypothetical protein